MPVNLDKALKWTTADTDETSMLADLQSNILKGHGRHVTRHLFLQFLDPKRGRQFLKTIEPLVISALEQLSQASRFKMSRISGGPTVCVFLSAKGYKFLGIAKKMPAAADEGAFIDGLAGRDIKDDPALIESGYQQDIHAKILIAGDPDGTEIWTSTAVDVLETKLLNLMSQAAKVVASEAGRAIFNKHHDGLEHFGYVDGRSQPLMLLEDVDAEAGNGGISDWDPTFPLSQVLVRDPAGASKNSFGSFFVFRKLEQNVAAFKKAEEEIGSASGVNNGELAGATLVGRFEDGTPVLVQKTDGANEPISNNFNYSGDPDGRKCPIHAHIRKTNPRGESAVKFGIPEAEERSHIMARRGIPYGRRNSTVEPTDRPTHKVGLLFMAYQSNLLNQFEFTQSTWANNPDFLDQATPTSDGTGIDPVIGQGGVSNLTHFAEWDNEASITKKIPFGGHVRHKGGEYFFAPSKSMLRSL